MFSQEITEQYLYHYTTLETAIEEILYSGQLRLGPFEQTNDPRESQNWGIGSVEGARNDRSFGKLIELINEDRLKRCKVLCLTRDDMEHHRLGFGRRGFARARMWAQYAGNHRGICLIFDAAKLDAIINRTLGCKGKIYKGIVEYTDSVAAVTEASTFRLEEGYKGKLEMIVQKHIDQYANTIFFNKNRDWKDETEYRYVFYSDDSQYQFIKIDNVLKGLVLGVDFPQVYAPVIAYFKKKYCLEVRNISWDHGIPSICSFESFR